MIGPNRPDASVCWCLSHWVDAKTNAQLRGPERGACMEALLSTHRGQGISHALLAGAVDSRGERIDLTMAFVGTRALLERAGSELAAPTDAVAGGFPRVLMRRQLERR
ncbi:MAG: hypothetical protein WC580_05805 [Agrococcus sp.]